MSRLDERVAVVTGGSRGIGSAVALELAKRGAAVVVNYNSNANAANEVVEMIQTSGSQAIAVQADVSDYSQADQLITRALDEFGKIDILVNNAGTNRDQLMMKMPEEDWDLVIRTNLKSAYNTSRPTIKAMIRKRYGRIINMSSVAGVIGNGGQTNYGASKAGLIGFTKSLAREVATRNITVNAVAPGFVPTDLTSTLPDDLKTASMNLVPMGRWGEAAEVAYAVAFLASDEASYITGHVLAVDGGMSMAG